MNRKLERHQQYCAPRTIFKEQKKRRSSWSCCWNPLYRLKQKYCIPPRWKLGWNLMINCVICFYNWAQAVNARQHSSLVHKKNIVLACYVPHTMLMLSVTAAEIAPHNPCVVYLSTICSCYRLVGDLQVATAPFRTPADGNGIASPPPLPLSTCVDYAIMWITVPCFMFKFVWMFLDCCFSLIMCVCVC
jgi:hypothetical protein